MNTTATCTSCVTTTAPTRASSLGGFFDEDDAEATKAKLKRPKEWEIISVPLNDNLDDPAGPPELDLFGHRIKDYDY